MDSFWLFGAIWAVIGALMSALLIRRSDVSRVGYKDARQMLSAIVSALTVRIQKLERLTDRLSDEVEIMRAKRTPTMTEAEVRTALLEYVQGWETNLKQVMQMLDELQMNVGRIDTEVQNVRTGFDHIKASDKVEGTDLGVVTENTFARLSGTERRVLLLLYEGPKSAPEIGELAGRSREHSGRLMKMLFEQGFVERETHRQPYRYMLNGKIREALSRSTIQTATQFERQS